MRWFYTRWLSYFHFVFFAMEAPHSFSDGSSLRFFYFFSISKLSFSIFCRFWRIAPEVKSLKLRRITRQQPCICRTGADELCLCWNAHESVSPTCWTWSLRESRVRCSSLTVRHLIFLKDRVVNIGLLGDFSEWSFPSIENLQSLVLATVDSR